MCGLAGIISFDGNETRFDLLRTFASELAHRGPDGEGFLVSDGIGLAHRRLAIIDPQGGHQPMRLVGIGIDGVYNGELYNHGELRSELESLGHRFSTRSDTEVVLRACAEWGASAPMRFRGMFALAVIDRHRGTALLARDQLGIKPLHYRIDGHQLAFASELRPLRHVGPATIDAAAIDRYLWFGCIPAPGTIYREIAKLLPGHTLEIRLDGSGLRIGRYWHPTRTDLGFAGVSEWAEAARSVIVDSVRAHLVSDVPFGVLLSGGLDSGIVAAAMRDAGIAQLRSFTIGFEDTDHDERDLAHAVAKHLGTRHADRRVDAGALELLPAIIRHAGEPFGDSSAIPMWHAAELARAAVPMVLSGDGGDELFTGYDSYRDWWHWRRAPCWRRWARTAASLVDRSRRPGDSLSEWLRVRAHIPWPLRRRLLGAAATDVPAHLQVALAGITDNDDMPRWADLNQYLPDDLLTKVDRMSMAHGLEVRTPLVDVRVVEFAMAAPFRLHAGPGDDGRWESKRLLRTLARAWLPPAVANGVKRGFSVPLARWLAPHLGAIRDRLTAQDGPLAAWLDVRAVAQVLETGNAGNTWLLLALDEWLRQHHRGEV